MTFMAKGLMMILLLLAVSACGLAQSCIPLEIQPFDYTLDVHGTRYVGTAVVSPVPGEPVYELTAIVRRFGPEACEKPVEERIAAYLSALPVCAQEADDGSHRWAPFLLDDSRPNKEQLLLEKRGGGFPAK